MLSYQHAYHAGGPADLHKHLALAALLTLLTRKARPISYLESHAGRGLYALDGPEAAKTGEAAAGIGRLTPGAGPFWEALAESRRRHGAAAYPGSPLIAAALLRPGDCIALCELHPAEEAGLAEALPKAAIHRRDGHEGLVALTPPTPRRGLALIDPSYEVKEEYARTAQTARSVGARWPEGVVAIWYPILPAARHGALVDPLAEAGAWQHEAPLRAPAERGLQGSGLLILNPPYGAAEALAAAWAPAAPVLDVSSPLRPARRSTAGAPRSLGSRTSGKGPPPRRG